MMLVTKSRGWTSRSDSLGNPGDMWRDTCGTRRLGREIDKSDLGQRLPESDVDTGITVLKNIQMLATIGEARYDLHKNFKMREIGCNRASMFSKRVAFRGKI